MTIKDWIIKASNELKAVGIDSARLDSQMIVEEIYKKNRAWVLANLDTEISTSKRQKLNNLFNQRLDYYPMAYILGRSEFYGHDFVISMNVLQPRPESEDFIEILAEIMENFDSPRVADVGTGSGALGITASLKWPKMVMDLIDIDDLALENAKINANKFTTPVKLIKSNLLDNAKAHYDILLCNLPYVPDDYPINKPTQHEPKLALFGGLDGLDVYRKLATQLQKRQKKPLFLLIESLELQHSEITNIFAKLGYKLQKTCGLVQLYKNV